MRRRGLVGKTVALAADGRTFILDKSSFTFSFSGTTDKLNLCLPYIFFYIPIPIEGWTYSLINKEFTPIIRIIFRT